MRLVPTRSLLYPRVQSLYNGMARLTGQGWGKLVGSAALAIGVWVGLYIGLVKLLEVCYSIELFGAILVDRLLTLFFLAFLGVLLFSNIVTSLATYYLSDELRLVFAAPVSALRVYYAKLVETVFVSSWMVLVFGVPVVIAYGTVHEAPWYFYIASVLVLAAFTLIPAAVGIVITSLLVNVFPARRTRDLLVIVTAAFLGGAWLLFRLLRPERLVDPDSFGGIAQFLGSFSIPEASWLPSTWAVQTLAPLMRGRLMDGLEAGGFLVLWAVAFVVIAAWITSAAYMSGWSKSQEGRPARLARWEASRLHRLADAILGPGGGALAVKDLKVLARDATQWSQLVLLLATTAIYLFSIGALPFDILDFDTRTYRNAVAFANVGFTGFVQAAVAARFVYPAVSAEGRGIWILRTAPTSTSAVLRSKWISGTIPLVLLGVVLAYFSNVLLRTDTLVRWVAIGNAILSGVGVSALAAGLGAMNPDFKAENAAKVAASFGGLVFMAFALAFLLVILVLQAYPVYRIYDAQLYSYRLPQNFWAIAVGCFGGSVAVGGAVVWYALREGEQALDAREY